MTLTKDDGVPTCIGGRLYEEWRKTGRQRGDDNVGRSSVIEPGHAVRGGDNTARGLHRVQARTSPHPRVPVVAADLAEFQRLLGHGRVDVDMWLSVTPESVIRPMAAPRRFGRCWPTSRDARLRSDEPGERRARRPLPVGPKSPAQWRALGRAVGHGPGARADTAAVEEAVAAMAT